jgi:PhoH-like ATPase
MSSRGKKKDKVYVLDTSVLVNDPNVIMHLGDNRIILPVTVLAELDKLKTREGNAGFSAREASKVIEALTNDGRKPEELRRGIPTSTGGTLMFSFPKEEDWGLLPLGFERNNDSQIVLAGLRAKKDYSKSQVIVLSSDTNLRINARLSGVEAEDYHRDRAITDISKLYTGRRLVKLPVGYEGLLQQMNLGEGLHVNSIKEFGGEDLLPNQVVELSVGDKYTCGIHKGGLIHGINKKVPDFQFKLVFKNPEQCAAYNLAVNPENELVSFSGTTGSGKTFIALLCAYISTYNDDDKSILVFRPNIELGKEIGFLPGDLTEKFAPWIRPIIDNMVRIIMMKNSCTKVEAIGVVLNLISSKSLVIQPISHIRGCTFHDTVLVIDEVQNLTYHETKSVITRAGNKTRIFLTGDPNQVDNRWLTRENNGLVCVTEKFKGQPNYAHFNFETSVRSRLAGQAERLLN